MAIDKERILVTTPTNDQMNSKKMSKMAARESSRRAGENVGVATVTSSLTFHIETDNYNNNNKDCLYVCVYYVLQIEPFHTIPHHYISPNGKQ